jgi:hypothetical protein
MKLTEEQKEAIEAEFKIFLKDEAQKNDDMSKMGVRGDSPLIKGDVTE